MMQRNAKRERIMQTIQNGYKSVSLLLSINWDRLLYCFAIVMALYLAAFVGSLAMGAMTHPISY
jgi:hypothetical protein